MRSTFLAAVAIVIVAFQLYVTLRLLRFEGYTGVQKLVQLILVWMIPLVGALVVYSVMAFTLRRPRNDTRFIPDRGGNPPGV
jgi:hypothetical protein